jgi:membrane protein DedA with SNARE-associated domain
MNGLLLAASVDQQMGCTLGSDGIIGTMTVWLVTLMERIGGLGAMLAIALESLFPPIPSEIILPLAGFTASRSPKMTLVSAICWATVGSLLGAWALYWLARWLGIERIYKAADRIPGIDRTQIQKADHWFTKYGSWSVLIGRVIPVVRSLISLPAGLNTMNFWKFTGWTLLGSSVWNSVLIGAGYMLGGQWCSIMGFLNAFEDVVIVAFVGLVLFFIGRRIQGTLRRRREREKQETVRGKQETVREKQETVREKQETVREKQETVREKQGDSAREIRGAGNGARGKGTARTQRRIR